LPSKTEKKHLDAIDYYFTHISLPCLDGSALVYPLYATLIDFKDTNIIDGSGNDIYFGHVPRPIEYKRQKDPSQVYIFKASCRTIANW